MLADVTRKLSWLRLQTNCSGALNLKHHAFSPAAPVPLRVGQSIVVLLRRPNEMRFAPLHSEHGGASTRRRRRVASRRRRRVEAGCSVVVGNSHALFGCATMAGCVPHIRHQLRLCVMARFIYHGDLMRRYRSEKPARFHSEPGRLSIRRARHTAQRHPARIW